MFTISTIKANIDILVSVVFWLLIILALLSVIPIDLRKGRKSLSLYFPILAVILAFLYEMGAELAIPSENVPIRVDLMVVVPLLVFIIFMGIVRVALLWYLKVMNHNQPVTGRKQQVVALIVIVFIMIWFCLVW